MISMRALSGQWWCSITTQGSIKSPQKRTFESFLTCSTASPIPYVHMSVIPKPLARIAKMERIVSKSTGSMAFLLARTLQWVVHDQKESNLQAIYLSPPLEETELHFLHRNQLFVPVNHLQPHPAPQFCSHHSVLELLNSRSAAASSQSYHQTRKKRL